jgi:hypothetical protein
MKTTLLSILVLVAGCCLASGQTKQYVTLTVPPTATNIYTVAQGQAAEIVFVWGGELSFTIQKNGLNFGPGFVTSSAGIIVQGPATMTFVSTSPPSNGPGLVTLKIIPESYDPNKTIIVPPGTNQVQITLQVSTNLINWETATNGIYGSPNTAQFFRIREDTLTSP